MLPCQDHKTLKVVLQDQRFHKLDFYIPKICYIIKLNYNINFLQNNYMFTFDSFGVKELLGGNGGGELMGVFITAA